MKKDDYYKRLAQFTSVSELKELLLTLDALNVTDELVKRVGAITLFRFKEMTRNQHIQLFESLKAGLVQIKQGGLNA